MSDLINDYIRLLKSDAKKVFPDAVSVEIFISADEVKVIPRYAGEFSGKSMMTISGELLHDQKGEYQC